MKKIIGAGLCLLTLNVYATTIKYEVAGVITQADAHAFTSFSVGDEWSTVLYGNNPSMI